MRFLGFYHFFCYHNHSSSDIWNGKVKGDDTIANIWFVYFFPETPYYLSSIVVIVLSSVTIDVLFAIHFQRIFQGSQKLLPHSSTIVGGDFNAHLLASVSDKIPLPLRVITPLFWVAVYKIQQHFSVLVWITRSFEDRQQSPLDTIVFLKQ